MVCPQCASDVAAGSTFCSACGARVNQPASPSFSTPGTVSSTQLRQPSAQLHQPGPQLGQPMAMQGPGAYGLDPKTGMAYSHRSKVVAGLLQIFLGGFGVGRFYTGHTGMAIAQIAVTFVTCGLGAFWPLIDGIMILAGESPKDADGRPLRPG